MVQEKYTAKAVEKKGFLRKALRFGSRMVDNATGGFTTNVFENNQEAGPGRVDWARLIGQLVPVILTVAFVAGWIDMPALKELFQLFKIF